MDLYLPIAEMSVNAPVIVALGLLVGFLSGMFGVGGGFLTTPLLIFYGIPPAVAVATSATQVTGSSVSGAMAYWESRSLDPKMGAVMVVGGLAGTVVGGAVFRWMQAAGQLDVVVPLVYVALLGTVGVLMLRDALGMRAGVKARRHHPLVAALPWRMRFPRSGLYISPLAPLLLGVAVGVLTVILGVGGGFIMVPAMLYLLAMPAAKVVGTSLFQIIFVTGAATLVHAVTSRSVDIVLAGLLLSGGVMGAQLGARAASRLPAERLRLFLALLVLGVAVRLLVGLTWRPPELYSVQPLA